MSIVIWTNLEKSFNYTHTIVMGVGCWRLAFWSLELMACCFSFQLLSLLYAVGLNDWLVGLINSGGCIRNPTKHKHARTQTHAQTNCTTNPVALNVPNVASVLRFFSSFFCQFFFLSFVNNYVRSTVRSINEWIWMWGKSLHWMVTLLNWC